MDKIMLKAVMFVLAGIVSLQGNANPLDTQKNRVGDFDISLQSRYTSGATINGQNGSKADVNGGWGWGFGFGYHFTNNFALNFDIGWNSVSYDATLVGDTVGTPSNLQGEQLYTGTLSTNSTLFTGIYNFTNKQLTPFVSGTLGWVFIDTHIPTGPPQNWCWWDPWYGYICSSYIPTKTETDFSYGAGLGMRYDVSRNFFVQASYNMLWIDFDSTSAANFDAFRIDFGFTN